MLNDIRQFLFEEDGEIVEWAVFMMILLALTVAIIVAVGGQAQTMWTRIQSWLNFAISKTGDPQ